MRGNVTRPVSVRTKKGKNWPYIIVATVDISIPSL